MYTCAFCNRSAVWSFLDYVQYEKLKIEGDDAAKMFHFNNTNLRELAENYPCNITREPPDGLVRTLIIAFKPKYRKKVETHVARMNLELKKLEVRQCTFNRDKSRLLSEYLKSSERLEDKVCYIPDIVNNSVDIVGRSYDEISKAEHRLKVCSFFMYKSVVAASKIINPASKIVFIGVTKHKCSKLSTWARFE